MFKKEENTKNAYWIFSLRLVDIDKTKNEVFEFFKDLNIDTRPFFYPINSHKHLNDIKFDDEIPYILNKEIIMIPSSPSITEQEQEYIVECIKKGW